MTTQLQLFTDQAPETKPARSYTVQRYKLSFVKEKQPPSERTLITNREDVKGFCKRALADMPFETVCIIAVDNGNRITGYTATEGDINQCSVYPASCFRFLLCAGAAAFCMAHNHPGGTLHPSQADWDITKRLKTAGAILGIGLLDHLLIADEKVVSLREETRWNAI